MRACSNGSVEVAQYLIEKMKANTELTNKNDENCLVLAVRKK